MAAPLSLTQALSNGTWLLAHPYRGFPRLSNPVITTGWYEKRDGWSALGELGGFVGQSPLAAGAPPRGIMILYQYDPDGGIEILDGEIRVERARPLPIPNGSTVAINWPGDLSLFRFNRWRIDGRHRVAGKADVRFLAGGSGASRLAVGFPVQLTQTGFRVATHLREGLRFRAGNLTQSFGDTDLRKSIFELSGSSTDTFGDLDAREARGPLNQNMRINATGNVDLSRARSVLSINLRVDGHFTAERCVRGIRCSNDSRVDGSVSLDHSHSVTLLLRAKVGGDFSAKFASILSIGNDCDIAGDASFRHGHVGSIGDNLKVGGNLDFSYCSVGKLGTGATITGDLILTGSNIRRVPDGWTVSGDVVP